MYGIHNNYQPSTIAVHFDGDKFTPEQIERIKAFAAFIQEEDKMKTKNKTAVSRVTEWTDQVYSFEGQEDSIQYAFENEIPVGIYEDLKICISDLLNN